MNNHWWQLSRQLHFLLFLLVKNNRERKKKRENKNIMWVWERKLSKSCCKIVVQISFIYKDIISLLATVRICSLLGGLHWTYFHRYSTSWPHLTPIKRKNGWVTTDHWTTTTNVIIALNQMQIHVKGFAILSFFFYKSLREISSRGFNLQLQFINHLLKRF